MTQVKRAILNDISEIAELAAQYSFIAIVMIGVASCFAGLI